MPEEYAGEYEEFLSIQAQDFIEEQATIVVLSQDVEFLSIQAQDFIEDLPAMASCFIKSNDS